MLSYGINVTAAGPRVVFSVIDTDEKDYLSALSNLHHKVSRCFPQVLD